MSQPGSGFLRRRVPAAVLLGLGVLVLGVNCATIWFAEQIYAVLCAMTPPMLALGALGLVLPGSLSLVSTEYADDYPTWQGILGVVVGGGMLVLGIVAYFVL